MNANHSFPGKDPMVRRFALICAIGLGGFLLWGGIAPLEEGVSALGQIVVESERKSVQHLEGGIIQELHVREGDYVSAGDVLVVLQNTASLAGRDEVIQQYASLAATVQRLTARQAGADQPNFELLADLNLGSQERQDIIERELALFRQQQQAQAADLAVLDARRQAAARIQQARTQQIDIVRRALKAAEEELSVINDLFTQQLARRDRLSSAQRQVADLEADIARLASEKTSARSEQLDVEAQISAAKARVAQDIAAELAESRAQLLAAEERLSAAQDVLDRAIIRAPVDGEVLNMQFATLGGVVRPGETLLEIIPRIAEVTASVRIKPGDRDTVYEGQQVRTQVSAFKGWRAPRFNGEVISVSADLKNDPTNASVYYEARVRIPANEVDRAQDIKIIPGMPVDAFIYSGRSRTFFEYLFEPLTESLYKGLRAS